MLERCAFKKLLKGLKKMRKKDLISKYQNFLSILWKRKLQFFIICKKDKYNLLKNNIQEIRF